MSPRNILCFNKVFTRDSNYTINSSLNNIFKTYAFKSDLKIKWIRPEKVSCCRPEKSGDLEGTPNLDKSTLLQKFNNSKELKTANENVRKLFTLDFFPKKYAKEYINQIMVDKVKQHEFDINSSEVKIAKWTGMIRAWQELNERFPSDKRLKLNLKELIDQRKKHLKRLRQCDYKKFEWLIENLNVVYKPSPLVSHPVTRKDSLQKLTKIYTDDIKQKKLHAYQIQLEQEQPAFLEEKIKGLQFIREEQMECGVKVTVTQKEIDEIKTQLKELRNLTDNK